jgi:hypothetical protein
VLESIMMKPGNQRRSQTAATVRIEIPRDLDDSQELAGEKTLSGAIDMAVLFIA